LVRFFLVLVGVGRVAGSSSCLPAFIACLSACFSVSGGATTNVIARNAIRTISQFQQGDGSVHGEGLKQAASENQ
jgi:hypothetical protein